MKRSTVFTLSVTLGLTVATPTITPNGATFSNSISVALESATSGSSIYYTTNGSTPTESSSLYTGAVTLTSSATIKAAAFRSGYNRSAVASASFTKNNTSTVSSNTSGNTYYVAKTGNDAYSCAQAQNQATPKLTINAGISCLSAGDTLQIKAGTYAETLGSYGRTIPSGTSWSRPTTISRYGSDVVTIRSIVLYSSTLQYIQFVGLIVDINGASGEPLLIANGANHIRFTDGEVKGSVAAAGIALYEADGNQGGYNEILNSKIYNNGTSTQLDHGIYVHSRGNLIKGNDIYANAATGIQFYNAGVSMGNGNRITGNKIHDNNGNHGGVMVSDAPGIIIDNNLIYNNGGYGRGIVLYTRSSEAKVYNNTITGNATYGVEIYNGAKNSVILNNLIYGNKLGAVSNNASGTTYDYNLETDPNFVNFSGNDFRLQSGSLGIDAGVDLSSQGIVTDFADSARPEGAGFDVGAFEYGS